MTGWDNTVCMAGKTARCTRKSKNSTDFCNYHIRCKKYHKPLLKTVRDEMVLEYDDDDDDDIISELESIYNKVHLSTLVNRVCERVAEQAAVLDTTSLHNLLYIKNSWSEVPFEHRIKLSDGYWDLTLLLDHFTQQLNSVDMENPASVYPASIMTKVPYSAKDLLIIKTFVKKLELPINVALHVFLNTSVQTHRKWHAEAVLDMNGRSKTMLKWLDQKLRFRTINSKDSQECFIGYWVDKNEPLSDFEELYEDFMDECLVIFDPIESEYVHNPDREALYLDLLDYPKETWCIDDKNNKRVLE